MNFGYDDTVDLLDDVKSIRSLQKYPTELPPSSIKNRPIKYNLSNSARLKIEKKEVDNRAAIKSKKNSFKYI